MPRSAMTVTIQRTGKLEVTCITECTLPVTGEPLSFNVVFSFRYWA
jgi:hypothetical protein